jgi:hypothetical protein
MGKARSTTDRRLARPSESIVLAPVLALALAIILYAPHDVDTDISTSVILIKCLCSPLPHEMSLQERPKISAVFISCSLDAAQ